MIGRGIFRFLCALAVGLALFDSAADAVCCDEAGAAATACHACFCGPRLVSPGGVATAPAPAAAQYASYKPTSYSFLLLKSFFRPPRLAA